MYTLRGINGHSRLAIQQINVYKVMNLTKHKRIFKILNQDYNYTLYIKYNEPVWRACLSIFGWNCAPPTNFSECQEISKRYKTEADIDTEIQKITDYKQTGIIQ
jgi:hypothetical protein